MIIFWILIFNFEKPLHPYHQHPYIYSWNNSLYFVSWDLWLKIIESTFIAKLKKNKHNYILNWNRIRDSWILSDSIVVEYLKMSKMKNVTLIGASSNCPCYSFLRNLGQFHIRATWVTLGRLPICYVCLCQISPWKRPNLLPIYQPCLGTNCTCGAYWKYNEIMNQIY